MKRILLSVIFLNVSFGLYAQTCPGEQLVSLGDDHSLSHTYFDQSTNTVFGVGYFTDTVTVGLAQYIAAQGNTGKYVVQMDTVGAVLNSYLVDQGNSTLEFPGGGGYFEPGIGLTDLNSIIVPTTYRDASGNFVFQVQAWDKGQQGLTLWTQQFTGTATVGANYGFDMIKISPTGDIILTGVYGDSLTTAQQQVFTAGTTSTGFVMVLNGNDGTLKSMTHITGSDRMELFGLTADDLGNIYVSGNTFNTTSINVDGNITTYTGANSGFLFKLNAAGGHQWTHIFESTAGPEPKAIQYDKVNDYIHYINTDYESFEKGSKLGALNAGDGKIAWERKMVVPGWHYISYSSWIDEADNAIYYSVWGKGVNQPEASLLIDGNVVKDRINTSTYFHKFSLDGTSQYISPSPFASIGAITVVSANRIIMQANYQRSRNLQGQMLGIFDPANYPAPFLYVQKEGVYLNEGGVTLTASSDVPDVTYQWMINGDPLAGEVNASFTPPSPGGYNVEISDGKNCPVRSRLYRIEGLPTLETDSLALVDLYNYTNGAEWFNSTNWLVGDVSTWYGVTAPGTRVTELHLANNNLKGNFPETMDRLTGLQQLYLDANNLAGSIPSSFWSAKDLININLHDNPDLYWALHPDMQNLTSLRSIRAFNTNLSGNIPAEIGNISTLDELWVSNCNLTGGLPPEIGNLPALTTLDLSNNAIGGAIPVEIGNVTTLELFQMGNCGLTGVIPDELWQLPNLVEIGANNNPKLSANLPANLETLTQLQGINLANIIPLATAFPEGLYSLVNLTSLDLGGHHLTGSLDSRVSNWKNLENLWLWSNDLEGAIPAEMAALPLSGASFSDNKFTSMPDLDPSDTTLFQLEVELNFLDFDDIARNMGYLEIFKYTPQKKMPATYVTVDEDGTVDLINNYNAEGNQYQWMLNFSDPISTNMNHTITGAALEDLGRYTCRITNPNARDLVIEADYNVAFSGPPRSFTVDNSPGSLADFKSFYTASYGTNDGDTIYVAGSATPYSMDFITFETPRIIYGPGYFLAENPETQVSKETARITGIGFMKGAEGSEVYGLDINQAMLNNQASYLNNTLRDVHFTGNIIRELSINDDCQNIYVNKNYINKFALASTSLVGVGRSYQDIFIEHNIIDTVTTTFAKATAERNEMINVKFGRNTIKIFMDSIQDVTVSNNIINDYQALGNTDSNNPNFSEAAFENNSGMLNIDNDFIPTNTSIDAGAFSGTDPYVLSGIPEAPHLYTLTNTGRIRINARGKTATDATITSLGYRLGQKGILVDEGIVKRLEAGNPIDVTFRPRLGKVTPGGTYDLMLWAQDDTGRKSIHQTIAFTAETTTAKGHLFSSDDLPVTKGEVMLFEVNQEGAAFDTLMTSLNSEGGFIFNNIVVGDYLAMGKADTTAFAEQLPTYYERIDLWEEADTLLLDIENTEFDIKLIAEPKPVEEGEGEIAGFIEEEYEVADETTGRVLKRERQRVSGAGVSVRRAVRTSRGSEVIYQMVAFLYSDEQGRFDFSSLPPDNYRMNIQYPGYPMDPSSDIDITIGSGSSNHFSVEALVAKGKISVSTTSVTGLMDEIIQSVRVYPNPTSTEGVTVEFLKDMDLKGEINLQLFDIKGNLASSKTVRVDDMRNNNEVRLSLDGFKKGIYLIKVYQANKVLATVRMVLQ